MLHAEIFYPVKWQGVKWQDRPIGSPVGAMVLAMRGKPTEVQAAEERIRARLRAYRQARDINNSELARRLGVSDSNLGRIMRGERGMSVGLLLAVRRVLSVSADVLLDEPARQKREHVGQ